MRSLTLAPLNIYSLKLKAINDSYIYILIGINLPSNVIDAMMVLHGNI